MKQVFYPALVSKDQDSDYDISFPDFAGCVSAGGTIEQAIRSAHEALQLHIEGIIEDKDPIPAATPLADVMTDDVLALVLIGARLPGKAQRVQITLDEHLLAEIDAVADNRSGFLAEAARDKLSRLMSNN
ncbi:type II toxin-antitoxin system HicB family antitoxin [Sneathiella sp. CAU 1612]|uniref:Type II toxin-antitoxin system HicB family antitoxin n=1 Tax=Sneathiella sedimenti TaxID=2816034 RepID=A0ABS3F7C8_9PROT|nr:type II toxin-antitoxin system HicB family antitoxin [Sneathiella sedimenti]MBO0334440.1 type II toxin-antitoxin system HicB family antitoxin [Sneathiella sedimenti]